MAGTTPTETAAGRPVGLIAQGWHKFAETCLPADAEAIQVQETRRAFYAGAIHLFYAVIRSLDADKEPTEKDLAVMDGLHSEVLAWVERLRAEAAREHGRHGQTE